MKLWLMKVFKGLAVCLVSLDDENELLMVNEHALHCNISQRVIQPENWTISEALLIKYSCFFISIHPLCVLASN